MTIRTPSLPTFAKVLPNSEKGGLAHRVPPTAATPQGFLCKNPQLTHIHQGGIFWTGNIFSLSHNCPFHCEK